MFTNNIYFKSLYFEVDAMSLFVKFFMKPRLEDKTVFEEMMCSRTE